MAPQRTGRPAWKRTRLRKNLAAERSSRLKSRRCAPRALRGAARAGPFSRRLSEQRDRITIERHAKLRLVGNTETLEKIPAQPRQIARMFGFEQNVPAPAILDPIDRTRCWTDDG